MHARYTIHQQPARPHEAAPASMRRPPRRHAASNVHSQHRDQRAYYTSKQTRTRARCTCIAVTRAPAFSAAASAVSRPPAARSTVVAPPLAAAYHRSLASPPRCCHRRLRRCSCRRGRRSCRAPQLDAYHCCCHRQRTCESRTGDSNRALGVGRRADADRERATRSARGGLRAR